MAQLNLLSGQVIPTALHTEMQQSYLEYAMSVIVGRALPDVRDGLKPVHRRILYAMHELGLTPDRPYRKCARVVGDVLGKYHPHGDQSVYDALVRLVQDFSSRYPLLAGHGNFGSIDNDPAAAMRYTETRLSAVGQDTLLEQVGEATVDFVGNFDNSQQEPTVLPAQLPILLLNGSSGIAVGMATNIPPHNLGEVVDGLIALIDRPTLSDEKLLELIPGPDFPTGGEILNNSGIRDAYTTGKGSITVRGIAKIEQVPTAHRRRMKTAIVVTELPFQVNKANWIEKMAGLVNAGRLEGISDIRDESDREGIRVVIELKRETSPEVVLHHLYQQTDLMTRFGAIFLALVDRQPRQLSLKQILQEFLQFREQTLIRQYSHELEVAERRAHVVEGLLLALTNLDDVIEILRHSTDGSTAKVAFESRLGLSAAQADAILAMPMRRLTGLEHQKLQDEFETLTARIQQLHQLIEQRPELLKVLKKELRSLKRQYGDERRTRIVQPEPETTPTPSHSTSSRRRTSQPGEKLKAAAPKAEETLVEFSHRGYVRRLSGKATDPKPVASQKVTVETTEDFTTHRYQTVTDQSFVILTRNGKAYPLNVAEIPSGSSRSRGTPLITLLPPSALKHDSISRQELVLTQFITADSPQTDIILLTQNGKIKRLPLTEFADLTNRGMTVVKLKEDDELSYGLLCQPSDRVIIATSAGRLLRLPINEEQLPIMGKTAQGSQATRFRKQEQLVGCVTVNPKGSVLLVSQLGEMKRMAVSQLRDSSRGSIGIQSYPLSATDHLVGLVAVEPHPLIHILTSHNRLIRLNGEKLKLKDKDANGDRIFKLAKGETVLNVKTD